METMAEHVQQGWQAQWAMMEDAGCSGGTAGGSGGCARVLDDAAVDALFCSTVGSTGAEMELVSDGHLRSFSDENNSVMTSSFDDDDADLLQLGSRPLSRFFPQVCGSTASTSPNAEADAMQAPVSPPPPPPLDDEHASFAHAAPSSWPSIAADLHARSQSLLSPSVFLMALDFDSELMLDPLSGDHAANSEQQQHQPMPPPVLAPPLFGAGVAAAPGGQSGASAGAAPPPAPPPPPPPPAPIRAAARSSTRPLAARPSVPIARAGTIRRRQYYSPASAISGAYAQRMGHRLPIGSRSTPSSPRVGGGASSSKAVSSSGGDNSIARTRALSLALPAAGSVVGTTAADTAAVAARRVGLPSALTDSVLATTAASGHASSRKAPGAGSSSASRLVVGGDEAAHPLSLTVAGVKGGGSGGGGAGAEEKRYECSVAGCGSQFSRRHNLKVHMRRHTGEMPYVCREPDCDKTFKWKSSMKHHERTHRKTTAAASASTATGAATTAATSSPDVSSSGVNGAIGDASVAAGACKETGAGFSAKSLSSRSKKHPATPAAAAVASPSSMFDAESSALSFSNGGALHA